MSKFIAPTPGQGFEFEWRPAVHIGRRGGAEPPCRREAAGRHFMSGRSCFAGTNSMLSRQPLMTRYYFDVTDADEPGLDGEGRFVEGSLMGAL